ncbi:MAG TPA: MFS transporter [Candidatus Binataceae bacterium]|nr:MFS transporter [Candidatus Binataceae bacterium]
MTLAPKTTYNASGAGPDFEPRSRRYLWALLGMLLSATVFEGYDITIFHLCTPDIARTFHMSDAAVGAMATTVRFGGILSFFVVTLADCFGRKRVLANTVLFYAVFTLFTALSSGVLSFTLFQSSAQIFLAAEFGVAVTMISEEFPDDLRARAISLLLMVAFLGVASAGLLYGRMADSRWGWRGMYFLGIAPLLLIAWLRRGMRETARFAALEEQRQAKGLARNKLFEPLRRCLQPMAGPWAGRMLLVSMLCNCIGLAGGPTISFFSLYAKRDHHWTSPQVGLAVVFAYLLGTAGTLISGQLLDRIGRRATTTLFFLITAGAMASLFHSDAHNSILLALMVTMFAYQGARTATSALSSELFPTGARATGFSLTVQVIGQLGWTLAPVIAGMLSEPLGGLGNAASVFAAGPVIGALLVLLFIPETRGKTLEELSPEAAASG